MPGVKLMLATSNVHKLAEIRKMIPAGYDIEVLGWNENELKPGIEETGSTFTENALIKARFVHHETGMNVLADDSGLEVDALGGAPGIYSARYAGKENDHKANIGKLLGELEGQQNRRARFVAVLVLIWLGKEYVFKGVCEGAIADSPSGEAGFGYDPVFIPEGFRETFAQMDPALKNRLSHRGMAMQKLMGFVKTELPL